MAWEQFEIWTHTGEKWELIASFRELELASAMVSSRGNNVKLTQVSYENGKRVKEEVLAELGGKRAS